MIYLYSLKRYNIYHRIFLEKEKVLINQKGELIMANMGFEGFDSSDDYHMSEAEQRKENWSQSKIWIILGVFMFLCLVMTIFMSGKEILLVLNGNCVEAEYTGDEKSVEIQDDQGNKYYINVNDTFISAKKGVLKLYYYGDNMRSAKPVTAAWYWLIMYCIWVPLVLLCVWRIHKNMKN